MVSPCWSEAVHCWLKEGWTWTRSSSISFCQYAETLSVSGPVRFTFHASFPAVNQRAPPCQAIASKVVGSSGKNVAIRVFGWAVFSFWAAVRNSAHVLGTVMPAFLKRSLR